jgi:hypothetical protein
MLADTGFTNRIFKYTGMIARMRLYTRRLQMKWTSLSVRTVSTVS